MKYDVFYSSPSLKRVQYEQIELRSNSPIKIYYGEFFLRRDVFLSVSNRCDDVRDQCYGIKNISFGKIRIAALDPILAPAPDSFKRYLENYLL